MIVFVFTFFAVYTVANEPAVMVVCWYQGVQGRTYMALLTKSPTMPIEHTRVCNWYTSGFV